MTWRTLNDLFCPHFSPHVLAKVTRGVRRHCMVLIKIFRHLNEYNLWFCMWLGYLPSLGFKRILKVKFLLLLSVKCTFTLIPSPSSLSRTGEKRMEHCLSCSRSARADLWSALLLRLHLQPRCKWQTPMRIALALELSNNTILSTVLKGRIFMKWFVRFTTASTWLQMPEDEKGKIQQLG